LLSLLFFGYIFSVSYVSLRESGLLQYAVVTVFPFVAEGILISFIHSAGGINAVVAIVVLYHPNYLFVWPIIFLTPIASYSLIYYL
jgi:hypothetical protein